MLVASSGTTTLRLQACRSLSVAIWLRGAFWCICRTPSTCPLRRSPTLGGDCTSARSFTDTDNEGKRIILTFNTANHTASIQQLNEAIYQLKQPNTLVVYWYLCGVCLVQVPRLGPVPQLVLPQPQALPRPLSGSAVPAAPGDFWLPHPGGCCAWLWPPRALQSAGWSPAQPPHHHLKMSSNREHKSVSWACPNLTVG